jgi:arylsulfatase A-like enzyme
MSDFLPCLRSLFVRSAVAFRLGICECFSARHVARRRAPARLEEAYSARSQGAFAIFAALVLSISVRGTENTSDPPNIILILADDMGYADLGCYGSEISTPNIDKLAERGLRFGQFYANAACCPTRAALLTGLYPHQAGVGWMVTHGSDIGPRGPYQGYLNDHCVTIAEVLKTRGYSTFMSGKWHVGESRPHWPVDRGFDRFFGLISGSANYFDISKDKRPSIVRQMAVDEQPYSPPPDGFYMTDAIADHAAAFLRDAATDKPPFFLYVAFTAPHSPLQSLAEDIAKYRGLYRSGWDDLRAARFRRMKAMGIMPPQLTLSPRDPKVPAWESADDQELMDLKMAIYAAQIKRMDDGIGRILRVLHDSGKEDNSLVIFLSDNGGASSEIAQARPKNLNRPPFLGGPESYDSYGRSWANASNTPFREFKASVYEGGIATPFIASWPAVIRNGGALCRRVAHVIDIMPTVLEITGAAYPQHHRSENILPLEGESFAASLRGEDHVRSKPLFWEFEGNRAVRAHHWKLVAKNGETWELYNLDNDRNELRDQSAKEPGRMRELARQYETWAQRCGVVAWEKIAPALRNLPP